MLPLSAAQLSDGKLNRSYVFEQLSLTSNACSSSSLSRLGGNRAPWKALAACDTTSASSHSYLLSFNDAIVPVLEIVCSTLPCPKHASPPPADTNRRCAISNIKQDRGCAGDACHFFVYRCDLVLREGEDVESNSLAGEASPSRRSRTDHPLLGRQGLADTSRNGIRLVKANRLLLGHVSC